MTIKSVVFTRYFMYQVDLIKGEIPKYQKVKKIVTKLQIFKVDIVGFLRCGTLAKNHSVWIFMVYFPRQKSIESF